MRGAADCQRHEERVRREEVKRLREKGQQKGDDRDADAYQGGHSKSAAIGDNGNASIRGGSSRLQQGEAERLYYETSGRDGGADPGSPIGDNGGEPVAGRGRKRRAPDEGGGVG